MTETNDQGPALVTRTEAAGILGVSSRTVTRYQKNGYLTTYRDDRGRVRFNEQELREMVKFTPTES